MFSCEAFSVTTYSLQATACTVSSITIPKQTQMPASPERADDARLHVMYTTSKLQFCDKHCLYERLKGRVPVCRAICMAALMIVPLHSDHTLKAR